MECYSQCAPHKYPGANPLLHRSGQSKSAWTDLLDALANMDHKLIGEPPLLREDLLRAEGVPDCRRRGSLGGEMSVPSAFQKSSNPLSFLADGGGGSEWGAAGRGV